MLFNRLPQFIGGRIFFDVYFRILCAIGLGECRTDGSGQIRGFIVDPPAAVHSLPLQRLVQVLIHLFEETNSGEPALIRADQQGEILGHIPGLDGTDDDFLKRLGKVL